MGRYGEKCTLPVFYYGSEYLAKNDNKALHELSDISLDTFDPIFSQLTRRHMEQSIFLSNKMQYHSNV